MENWRVVDKEAKGVVTGGIIKGVGFLIWEAVEACQPVGLGF